MKLPRVRFTMRRMMIAVAVIGLILGVYVWVDAMIRRSNEFYRTAQKQKLAEDIRISEVNNCKSIEKMEETMLKTTRVVYPSNAWLIRRAQRNLDKARAEVDRYQKKAEYRTSLYNKYIRASKRPWMTVEPDPPEPQ